MNQFKLYEITMDGFQSLLENHEIIKQDIDVESMFVQRPSFNITDDGVNKIAHISVFGPLLRNASVLEQYTGITTYKQIQDELEMSKEVDYVILHMDSPGGESMESEETANAIMNHPVPVYAVVKGICASACYKLASSCTEIFASVSSEIGSIGSIIAFNNNKKAMNAMGVERNIFINTEAAIIKGIGQDFGNLSPEQSEVLKRRVEESGKRFQQFVKTARPEINEAVFNADMYRADQALQLGLIDGVI